MLPANMPLEWGSHHLPLASPPKTSCLPLRGSVDLKESLDDSQAFAPGSTKAAVERSAEVASFSGNQLDDRQHPG
jgi:hypothetical protein